MGEKAYIIDPTPEQIAYFTKRNWTYNWGDTGFCAGDYDWQATVRLYLGGWQARYELDDGWHGSNARSWSSPFFDDPITAYIYAETCQWGAQ